MFAETSWTNPHHLLHLLKGKARIAERVWVPGVNSHFLFSTWSNCKRTIDNMYSLDLWINWSIRNCQYNLFIFRIFRLLRLPIQRWLRIDSIDQSLLCTTIFLIYFLAIVALFSKRFGNLNVCPENICPHRDHDIFCSNQGMTTSVIGWKQHEMSLINLPCVSTGDLFYLNEDRQDNRFHTAYASMQSTHFYYCFVCRINIDSDKIYTRNSVSKLILNTMSIPMHYDLITFDLCFFCFAMSLLVWNKSKKATIQWVHNHSTDEAWSFCKER